jgi:hypothetical protein
MTPSRTRERGEGRIGCILSLLVLIAAVALSAKLLPVFYANYALKSYAEELGDKAGLYPPAVLEQQLRDKAKELHIPEALGEDALAVATTGEQARGVCTINLRYRQTVDLYGITTLVVDTEKTIARPYMDSR